MRKIPTLVVLLGTVAAMSAIAQTTEVPPAWKWRDASGQINISDLPPPASVLPKDILERPPTLRRVAVLPPTSAAPTTPALHALSAPRTDPELEVRRKRAQEEQAVQQRQQLEQAAAVRADNCGRAQAALALLSDGQRVSRTNAQGEREVLDDKARADELQRIRSVVASDCR